MRFYDKVSFNRKGKIKVTKAGFLTGKAKVARVGIQEYTGEELCIGGQKRYRMYRPEEEVFSDEAIESFKNTPMTMGHPKEFINPSNFKDLAIGYSSSDVEIKDDYVEVTLTITDADAIDAYNNGVRQLSMGYNANIDWTPGITDEGEEYDCKQIGLCNNHIALVRNGRAGYEARFGDSDDKLNDKEGHNMTQVTINGVTYEVSEEAKAAIDALKAKAESADSKISEVSEKLGALKVELEQLKAKNDANADLVTEKEKEIQELKDSMLSDEQISQAVKEITEVVEKAKKFADADYSGLNVSEVKKKAVSVVIGDEAIKDKSSEYISARFDILSEEGAGTQHKGSEGFNDSAENTGTSYDKYVNRVANAWKN